MKKFNFINQKEGDNIKKMDSDEDSQKAIKLVQGIFYSVTVSKIICIVIGTALIAFAFYNIHQPANITEGGGFGLLLLFNHWFGLQPYIASPIMDIVLYIIAVRFLGLKFLRISILSTIMLTTFLKVFASLPLSIFLDISQQPLISALVGGVFVGVGAGLVVLQGGSCGGDDASAITLSKITGFRISLVYLVIDGTVLLLSMTYIPVNRIAFSIVAAMISSLFLDLTISIGNIDMLGVILKYLGPDKSLINYSVISRTTLPKVVPSSSNIQRPNLHTFRLVAGAGTPLVFEDG